MELPQASFGPEEIEHRFGFHKATIEGENATLPKHREVRLLFREFAEKLDRILPPGRAKSVAFTELENSSMWCHKSIAETAPALAEFQEGNTKPAAGVNICGAKGPREASSVCVRYPHTEGEHQDKDGGFWFRG